MKYIVVGQTGKDTCHKIAKMFIFPMIIVRYLPTLAKI